MTMTEIETVITVYPDPHEYGVAWSRDDGGYVASGGIGPRLNTYEDAFDVVVWLSSVDPGATTRGDTFQTTSPVIRLESLLNGRLAHPSEQYRVRRDP